MPLAQSHGEKLGTPPGGPLLELREVRSGYGDSVIVDGVSLSLAEGGSLAVLGRNGVGKSTLLLTIMGQSRVHRGEIFWRGSPISRAPMHRRARLGIGWVAQEREIFPSLTVEENLCVAARPGAWTLARAYELFPRLAERRRNRGDQLSGGEQQMLAIARALMTNPALLLLDEPLEGLAPIIVDELAAAIGRLSGMALVLVEQHAEIALALTREALVIERGRVTWQGSSSVLANDERLLERALGLAGQP
jgi:branched-chain amino acid transport system ATP-binding protein